MNPDPLAEIIAHHEAEATIRQRQSRDASAGTAATERAAVNRAWWVNHHGTAAEMHRRFAATLKAAVELLQEAASDIEAEARARHLPSHVVEHHPVSVRLYERDTEIVRRIRVLLPGDGT